MSCTRPFAVTLTGTVLTAAALAGCGHKFGDSSHVAQPAATTSSPDQQRVSCAEQVAWNLRGQASVKALYADTGALASDASAENLPGVTKAGRKLASDAIAAAALPLPPVDPSSWKALTSDYAAAGTAIASGNTSGAVPQLEAGNSAISAFSAATAKCSGTSL
ncbi:MAG: hypothetical protein ACRDOA_17550 [Streptosporangiaceae bacterium]